MIFTLVRFRPPRRSQRALLLLAGMVFIANWHAPARADDSISQAAYSTQVVELPQQMPVIPVCPPTEPYVLPGDPNAPVVIDNQLTMPAPLVPVAPTDSLVPFLRAALGSPVQAYGTFIPRNGKSAVGMDEVNTTATIPVPFPGDKWALLFTPSSQVRFLDGPVTPNLPSRLIDTNLGVNIVGELPYNFVVDAGAVPGYHSEGDDNRNGDSSRNGAIRVPYFALIGYRFTPTFLFAAGAADLERRDARWIPVAGLIWLPDDNTRIDIIPPKPKIAHRFQVAPTFERWWYFAADFGGGQWAIRDANGGEDVLTYQDYRIINGVEQRSLVGGLGGFFEYGYVFGRKFEFSSGLPNYDPHSTLMARLGLQY
jgi:hypothetical protein